MEFNKVLQLIDAMNAEGVQYITFGAIALNLHGIVRATTDADFFVQPRRDNIERLKRALRRVWNGPSHRGDQRGRPTRRLSIGDVRAAGRIVRHRLSHTSWRGVFL